MGYYILGGINRHYLSDPNTQSLLSIEDATPPIVDANGREVLWRTEDYIRINRIFTENEIERILGFPHPAFCGYTNVVASNESRGVVIHLSDRIKLERQENLVELYFIWRELNNDRNETPRWTGGTESHWG
ncbi:hypothetical protein KA036_02610 [Candidatus Gracilibacteria bacterium]|nr:hypothetical protein [Candidatus Gracilibacteria bacterium]